MAETIAKLAGTLAERYAISGEVGSGGMATVFRALDLRHGGQVAIKVLRWELISPVTAERFAREIRITARLQHPNILPLLDSGTIGEQPYYVMPFVEGETLSARLQHEPQLPIDEAIRIASDVADALSYAHRQGVVHRDIKPGNILLSHGRAIVADFGIARALDAATGDRLTESGLALGTAHYMSPEQASTGTVDGRSDIYSLGCLLYQMLAGSPPFEGPSVQTVMARHAADPVPPLRTVRTTVTPALEEAIDRALSKTPADRYATPDDFKMAIQRAAIDPRRLTRRELTRRWGAAVAVAAVGVAAIALWPGQRDGAIPLDRNRVMVFPLAVASDPGIPANLGENVATVIGSVLDGTGPLRWIDAWPLIDPNSSGTPDERARALARSKGCAFFITGRIFTANDSVRTVLYLHDVAGDSTIATPPASGPADPLRLALQSVNRILPKLIQGVPPNATAGWEDRNPKAMASYLLAESDFRRARFASALEHYRAAIEADSAFGLAAIRGAQAASWDHRANEAASFIGVATRHELPPRYAEFARGYQAFLDGRADSAAAAFRRALDADPRMLEAWQQLGEVHAHLLPLSGDVDSMAAAAFEAAHRLDSAATTPLFHLILIRLRQGNVPAATPLVRQFLATSGDTALVRHVQIMADCVTRGASRIDWRVLARTQPLGLYSASSALAAGAANGSCARSGFDALLREDTSKSADANGRRWNSLIGATALAMVSGKSSEGAALVAEYNSRWGYGASLFLFAAPLDSVFARRATALAGDEAQKWGTNYERLPYVTRRWELGLLAASSSQTDRARVIAADLRRRADSTRVPRDLLLARSLFVRLALAAGDTATAIDTLRVLVPAAAPTMDVGFDEAWPLAGERLILAELMLVRGRPKLALDIASVIDSPGAVFNVFYVARSLAIRLEAAKALADAPLQRRLRQRLDALQER